jgi:hypothetical protein
LSDERLAELDNAACDQLARNPNGLWQEMTAQEARYLVTQELSRRAANSAGGVEVKADCADEGHDHPSHDWRTACLKCGVFKGSDLYTHPSSPVSAEVTVTNEMANAALAKSRDKSLNTLTNTEAMRQIVLAALNGKE